MDAKVLELQQRLIDTVSNYCERELNDEYKMLCINVIKKMGRKREVPFMRGNIQIWAAAIIYAIGQINFLFDATQELHKSSDEICDYFEVSKSTISQRAKVIREMLNISYFDNEYSLMAILKANPLNSLEMINGFIVPRDQIE